MPRYYATLEMVKSGSSSNGDSENARILRHLKSASQKIENALRTTFVPVTETRLYRWPPRDRAPRYVLELPRYLVALTTLKTQAQDASPTTIAATDYFLEPQWGPPYDRIEIDLSSTAAFESGNTPQRSISVAGRWGWKEDTETGGTVDGSGLASSSTATSFTCSDSSLIGVGDTLLIESEQVLVTKKTSAALGSILLNESSSSVTKDMADKTVNVDGSHGLVAGEVILVDSERMFIEDISTNALTVVRAYDGSALAAHTDDTAVHVYRTLTIVRGVNGTTAATHADTTAISKYEIPGDIVQLCLAEAIAGVHNERAGYGRTIGAGESPLEWKGDIIKGLWLDAEKYKRMFYGAVV